MTAAGGPDGHALISLTKPSQHGSTIVTTAVRPPGSEAAIAEVHPNTGQKILTVFEAGSRESLLGDRFNYVEMGRS
jgi:hypothetical protein